MALDVKVTIKLAEVIGKLGSWYPLIYVVKDTDETSVYKEYTKLTEVAEDYEATTDAYRAASLIFMQENAPSKIAICKGETDVMKGLAEYMNYGWRQLIVLSDFNAAVATAIEATENKMYFARFDTVAALNSAATATTDAIKEYNRTFAVVYKQPTEGDKVFAEAAIVGATAGLEAGSFTYKNMIIKGVSPMNYSDTEIDAIGKAGGVTIVEKAGDVVTSDGVVVSGEFADIIDSKDYIIQNISYNTQKAFNVNKKVPYTNSGIAMLEVATLEALKGAYNNGMIADNEDGSPAYSVNFALRGATTETDRATRHYPYGQFAFALAGAIHTCEVEGEITV